MTPSLRRPRVICHMATSIDGRIVVDGWPDAATAAVRRHYEQVHAEYDAEAWICGRVTMEPFAGGVRDAAAVAREHPRGAPREDHVAPGDHASYAFAIDPSGRLAWTSNDIDGDHVVAIVGERVSDEYLAFLREREVSYLLAGAGRELDVALALEKIGARFGVRTLLLEGGGRINGAFLRAGLIDEVSLLVAPVADGRLGTPALFDVEGETVRGRFVLEAVEPREDDVVWLRYRVARTEEDERVPPARPG
ncbi:MAG TPA: RibD family protein [Gemmatimonadaceae bacterium]|nr:RibD family protein [Gemmatimonadaceae bacterium]